MAKPNRMKDLQMRHGSLIELIPRTINQEGNLTKAAQRLGVSDSTLSVWVKANGYKLITLCVPTALTQEEKP